MKKKFLIPTIVSFFLLALAFIGSSFFASKAKEKVISDEAIRSHKSLWKQGVSHSLNKLEISTANLKNKEGFGGAIQFNDEKLLSKNSTELINSLRENGIASGLAVFDLEGNLLFHDIERSFIPSVKEYVSSSIQDKLKLKSGVIKNKNGHPLIQSTKEVLFHDQIVGHAIFVHTPISASKEFSNAIDGSLTIRKINGDTAYQSNSSNSLKTDVINKIVSSLSKDAISSHKIVNSGLNKLSVSKQPILSLIHI